MHIRDIFLFSLQPYKVGPLLVINGVITPVSGVITPVTHLFSAIYRAYNSTYNDRRGPPCKNPSYVTRRGSDVSTVLEEMGS